MRSPLLYSSFIKSSLKSNTSTTNNIKVPLLNEFSISLLTLPILKNIELQEQNIIDDKENKEKKINDSLYTIGISLYNLRKLNLISHTYIKIKSLYNDIIYYGILKYYDTDDKEDEKLYVSSSIYTYLELDIHVSNVIIERLDYIPSICNNIIISPISMTYKLDYSNYLKRYLKKLPYIFNNMILCIKIDELFEFEDNENIEFDNTIDYIFFKVTNISPNEFCILDTNITKVMSGTYIQDRAPYGLISYLNNNNLNNYSFPKSRFSENCKLIAEQINIPWNSTYFSDTLPNLNSIIAPSMTIIENSPIPSPILLAGSTGSGKRSIIKTSARVFGLHYLEVNSFQIIDLDSLKKSVRFAEKYAPCILNFRKINAWDDTMATHFKEFIRTVNITAPHIMFVICTVSNLDSVPALMKGMFLHEIILSTPDLNQRVSILEGLLSDISTSILPTDIAENVHTFSKHIASLTAGMSYGDLKNCIATIMQNVTKRILNKTSPSQNLDVSHHDEHLSISEFEELYAPSPSDVISAVPSLAPSLNNSPVPNGFNRLETVSMEVKLLNSDIVDTMALIAKRNASMGANTVSTIPSVTWNDVGGLASAKSEIMDTIELPLKFPSLFASGLKQRSGLLFYGPPGTGKTLLAKAVATECKLNFISVKGPELLNMYIGESEKNIREVFNRARSSKPCVLFFDEMDSLAPARGNGSDSGGVMDRVVSQLLTELDGMNKSNDVFIIGATNRPDLLDSALLRPGRLDRCIYLGLSETHEQQLGILQALTRKFKLDADVNLENISVQCPFNFTGADFYALCSDALMLSYRRKTDEIDRCLLLKNTKSEIKLSVRSFLDSLHDEDLEVTVSMSDFENSIKNLTPSVSMAELQHYKKLQSEFQSNRTK